MYNIWEYKVKTNLSNKDTILDLTLDRIESIPDLSKHTWLEKLNLKDNFIEKVERQNLPPNIKTLNLSRNKISKISADDLPENLEELDLSNNDIEKFDGSKMLNLKTLLIADNELEKDNFIFPPNLENLRISGNKLENLGTLPNSLRLLDCSDNEIKEITINEGLLRIDLSDNKIEEWPFFHDSVELIVCEKNSITKIDRLPKSLTALKLYNNQIKEISCQLPPGLQELDLSDNILSEMPDLPTRITTVDISENRITELKNIPESVKKLNCSNNLLTEINPDLLQRDINIDYDNNYIDSDEGDSLFKSSPPPGFNNHNYNKYHNLYGNSYKGTTYNSTNYYNYNHYGNYWSQYSGNSWRSNTESVTYSNPKAKSENPYFISAKKRKEIII